MALRSNMLGIITSYLGVAFWVSYYHGFLTCFGLTLNYYTKLNLKCIIINCFKFVYCISIFVFIQNGIKSLDWCRNIEVPNICTTSSFRGLRPKTKVVLPLLHCTMLDQGLPCFGHLDKSLFLENMLVQEKLHF